MGIDCKKVSRIIHFGPSNNIECYIQESGRAGREGQQSCCFVLFNGPLSAHCSDEMKELLHDETGCRRQGLMKPFGFDSPIVTPLHKCCDNCSRRCKCGDDCSTSRPSILQKFPSSCTDIGDEHIRTRTVTNEQRLQLESELLDYRRGLIRNQASDLINTVSLPSTLLEFGSLQMRQIIENCHALFTANDVHVKVEVWRENHVVGILRILQEIFGDIDDEELTLTLDTSLDDEIMGVMEWDEIINDLSMVSLMDMSDLSFDQSTYLSDNEGVSVTDSFFQRVLP
eukprot:gene14542-16045_t